MATFRNPRTRQERAVDARLYRELAEIRAFGPFVSRLRGGKRGHGLPTSYDDVFIRTQRSWKRTRKTQYRVR